MKVKSPLLSFSASGSLANLITFLNIRGSTYAKTKQGKIGGTSAAQLLQRAKFKAACAASHLLTDEEKLYYHNLDIRSASCSWFNNFMSTFLLEEEAPPETMIESIQCILFTLETDQTDDVVLIDEVNLDYSVILPTSFTGSCWDHRAMFSHFRFTDSTHVCAHRNFAQPDETQYFTVFVVEFKSSAIQSIQHLSATYEHQVKDLYLDINQVDLTKSVIFLNGYEINEDFGAQFYIFTLCFSDSTHVHAWRESGWKWVFFRYAVVEFK